MLERGEDERKNGEFAYIMGCGFLMRPTLLYTDTSDCCFLFYPFPSHDVVLI